MSVFQTAFYSASTTLFTAADIDNILTVSRKNNGVEGITSALLYKDGEILQIMEGDKEAVLSRFRVIEKDPRHCRMIQVYEREIPERDFLGLSMGFDDLKSHEELFYPASPSLYGDHLPWHGFPRPSIAMSLIASFKKKFR